jgi:uncharacterized protein (DUF608 family)
MQVPVKKGAAFTKKNQLPRFNFVAEAHKINTIKQVKSLGNLIGSKGLMRLFPEFERATLGQLIRHHT